MIKRLAALGNVPSQLRFHIRGALNVRCSPSAIVEGFIHVAIYAGFPAALNALADAGGDQIGRVIERLGDASSNDDEANRYV